MKFIWMLFFFVCMCRILFSLHPNTLYKIKSNWYYSWEGDRQGWELNAFTFSCFHFISFLFFKSTEQVKRQEESIMQIMSLCIMFHDWNMQMSFCIIYECQCLSKSVTHNLQSELTGHGEGKLFQLHCQESSIYFPTSNSSNIECYLKEIKVPNVYENDYFSFHSFQPNSLPKSLQEITGF